MTSVVPAGRMLPAALLAAAALSACAGSDDPPPPPAASGSVSALAQCGSERFGLRWPPEPGDAHRCFADALAAGRAASMRSTVLTTEGDPIIYTLTSEPDGTITVEIDDSQDHFRGVDTPPRSRYTCTSLDTDTRPGEWDPVHLHLHGCGTPTPI